MTTVQAPSQPLPQPSYSSLLRLTRLKIHHFRNVQPNTELFFNDRYNVLLGVNASGKTTLLNLISACIRGDFSEYNGDDFHIEFDILLGFFYLKIEIRCQNILVRKMNKKEDMISFLDECFYLVLLNEKEKINGIIFKGSRDNQQNEDESALDFSIRSEFSVFAKHFWSSVASDVARLLSKNPKNNTKIIDAAGFFFMIGDMSAPCVRFDEELGFFRRMESLNDSLSINISINKDGKVRNNGGDFVPTYGFDFEDSKPIHDFLSEKIKSGIDYVSICVSKKDEDFILMSKLLDGGNVYLNFKEMDRILQGDLIFSRFSMFGFYIVWNNGDKKNHNLLSYGQKRLVSLIYFIACNHDVVIVDELVNGMHHQWIRECVRLIENRQSFLTSQSPLLLDCLYFEKQEEVQRTFIRCRQVKGESDEVQLVWENLGEWESEAFFRAYDVGIQYVSEILKAQGLW